MKDCNEALVGDILAGRFDPGSVISSARPFQDVPTVEERMPEIRASAFVRGIRHGLTTIPMLASMGCPYRCDFSIGLLATAAASVTGSTGFFMWVW